MANEYSRHYVPAMPVLALSLCAPENVSAGVSVTALIDSGADVCVVPRTLLSRLDLSVGETAWIRGQWGEPIQVTRYVLDLQLENSTVLPSVDAVSDPVGREVILGRNVLNKLRLLLDGPRQVTEIL